MRELWPQHCIHLWLMVFVGDKAPQDDTHQDTGLNTGTNTCTFLTVTHLKYWHSSPISLILLIQHPEPIYDSNIFYSSCFLEIALHSSQHIISEQHSEMQRLPDKIKCFLTRFTLNFKPSNLVSFSDWWEITIETFKWVSSVYGTD